MISVIIPTFNEIKHGFLPKILDSFAPYNDIEIICVDSNSTDGTRELINTRAHIKLIHHITRSRGERLTVGAKQAQFDMVVLHHPRTLLSQDAITQLLNQQQSLQWGAFTHKFNNRNSLLSFASWYSNHIRGDLFKVFYLDHCVFVKKPLLEQISYLRSVDIFEDTYLSHDLRKITPPTRLKAIATTSAIRFTHNGKLKQFAHNHWLKIQFFLGRHHKKMNRRYEHNLSLNCDYSETNIPENDAATNNAQNISEPST